MLYIHKARNLELLADKYHQINLNIERPLLAPSPLLVPNMAIGRWLIQYLAKKQSVCANLERVIPGAFVWRLIRKINPSFPKRSDFCEDVMLFRILSLLEKSDFTEAFPRLHTYISSCSYADKVELAKKIAKVFDQYAFFRSDWLEQWGVGAAIGLGDDEAWQQALWLELISQSEQPYQAGLEAELSQAILSSPESLGLPKTICLFGSGALAPGFIKILKILSEIRDVHVFAFCSDESDPSSDILSHWKISEQGFFQQLATAGNTLSEDSEPKNQLQSLQRKIAVKDFKNHSKLERDESITCVSCYSPMREVEAMYDYLVRLFARDKSLRAGDVLVALPNLEVYAPYIKAVFEGSDQKIPYRISDSLAAVESPLVNGFLELLALPKWRFSIEQVMVLLRNRLVQKRFNISDIDLEQIVAWLEEAGVRWGVDVEHKQDLDLPASYDNTWRAGLDRLLLGLALPKALSENTPLFNSVLPVDNIESSGRETLSSLVAFCEKLFFWRKQLNKGFSAEEWQYQLQALLSDFFGKEQSEERNTLQLLQLFNQLSEDAQQADYVQQMDAESIISILKKGISSDSRGAGLSGNINIASMASLAGIPFKHICFLGMNFDSWPSQQREPSFDLMQKHFRAGDRNRSNDERNLTLQMLLSAKEGLYLSYTGRNINNGTKMPPSVLLAELLDACEKHGVAISTWPHPMHAYSQDNFSSDSPLQSHNSMWLETAKKSGTGRNPIPTMAQSDRSIKIDISKEIDFDDLCRFFANPQSYFLRQRLGVFISDDRKNWNNAEPFSLANFADSKVREIALSQTLVGEGDSAAAMTRGAAILPHGEHGDLLQRKEQEKVSELVAKLPPSFSEQVLAPLTVRFNLGEYKISGVLRNLRPEGLLIANANKIYPYQKIGYWLQHLLLCCTQPGAVVCTTQVYHLEGCFEFERPENPMNLLQDWLSAYLYGQLIPLEFFAKASWPYAETFIKTGDELKALKAAENKWQDTYIPNIGLIPGEKSKPANQYLYRGHSPLNADFQDWANRLLLPLIENERSSS